LAALLLMFGQRDALKLAFHQTSMRRDVTGVELNFDRRFGFADLHATSDPIGGNRVAVGMQADIAVDDFDRRTLRTLVRDRFNTRAISRLETPCSRSSRIAVRWLWLNMLMLLIDAFR
jgi:hypothetical protein